MVASTLGRRLVLVGSAHTRTFRNIWLLEELGVPFEHVDTFPMSSKARALSPSGKLPVLLEYDDPDPLSSLPPSFVLTESAAINTYLSCQYGSHTSPALVPPFATRERARYDEIVSSVLSELDSQAWIHRKHDVMASVFGSCPNAVRHARSQFVRMNEYIAARHLQQPGHLYLLGSNFTAADILYIHCLDWAKSIGWNNVNDHVGEDASNNKPNSAWDELGLTAYRNRCQERPAFQRARERRKQGKTMRMPSPRTSEM
jgi:glutathione S-transferase